MASSTAPDSSATDNAADRADHRGGLIFLPGLYVRDGFSGRSFAPAAAGDSEGATVRRLDIEPGDAPAGTASGAMARPVTGAVTNRLSGTARGVAALAAAERTAGISSGSA